MFDLFTFFFFSFLHCVSLSSYMYMPECVCVCVCVFLQVHAWRMHDVCVVCVCTSIDIKFDNCLTTIAYQLKLKRSMNIAL